MPIIMAFLLIVGSTTNVKQDADILPSPPAILKFPSQFFSPELFDRGLGAPRLQLTISASGQPLRCNIIRSSGNNEVDANACKTMRQTKFKPAQDIDGNLIIGIYNTNFTYLLDGKTTNSPPPVDLQVVVERLPNGSGSFQDRDTALTVDKSGKVEACHVLRSTSQPDSLGRVACKMAISDLTFQPALDQNNEPVRSIQSFAVEFSQADAPLTRNSERKID